ncbi:MULTISPECIES: TetR/AcrR family transcriptional regulator [unclassified Streptomyces]|uniref:TetR/AcrR family transcriptional regulator n=1 Tax=unclassified Streptomyces TaxID=2593676 RepID=UPI0020302CD6|nr:MULTISPECIES: TetR/AcrR family transcriptional regulator [unclassified Streptomyces]MCM1969746.1 TetR/AcrR family transcriptional regulator [Streptomyces sp. G1]MCX5129812.1 TetR/AcrR family transcriptional regulator [Streptomyces sp. NBC_00347]MCX5300506.1 TetR/AcrR family transcriptional regulator [Streptomyces sp. NBC_00193]
MGRPRGVEDVVILRAAAQVMGRVGPAGLTLAAVAGEVGLVPGTLVQRFGSKRGLLLALADQSEKDATETAGRVRQAHDSALGALAALTVESAAVMATPESFAHHLAFLCMDLADPQLYERALAIHRTHRHAIEELLREAAGTGELRSTTDTAALARTVQVVIAGAGLTWALEREGTLEERLRQELDAALSPHLPLGDGHDLEES